MDGKALSAEIRADLKERILKFSETNNRRIGLAVVLAGGDPASRIYVRNKIKACEEVGIKSFAYYLPEETPQKELEALVSGLAENKDIDGILVQLPLPAKLDAEKILKLIPAGKDVDGFSEVSLGRLAKNKAGFISCTPSGIMKLLEKYDIPVSGKNAVVLGRSEIVGKPMAMLLLNVDATVTVCHSKTRNLKEICRSADILVAAVGKPNFVKEDMVKEGAVVIDVGINRTEGGLCGDVDFENVKNKCSYITPVPGGVGPMTITMLMYNAFLAAVNK